MLYQGLQGGLPTADEAEDYWEEIGEPDYPVASGIDGDVREATGYTSGGLPGNVVVTPDFEILEIRNGHDTDQWAFDLILEHVADN